MFICTSQFITNWFKIVLMKRETEGVNFWWLDWGQGMHLTVNCIIPYYITFCSGNEHWIEIPRMNPIYWQNYIFYTDPYHWNNTVYLAICLYTYICLLQKLYHFV